MIDAQLKGAAALKALEEADRLFAYPSEVAAVLERDLKTVYLGLRREEIPSTRIGQRYQIAMAWLKRQAAGVPGYRPQDAALPGRPVERGHASATSSAANLLVTPAVVTGSGECKGTAHGTGTAE